MSSVTGNVFFQVYRIFFFYKLLSKRGQVHFQNSFIESVHEFFKCTTDLLSILDSSFSIKSFKTDRSSFLEKFIEKENPV